MVQLNEQASEINADPTPPPDPSPLACSTRRRNKRPVSCSLPLEKGETGGVMAVLASCYYSATFPSLLYPVPMEDDSCKRVEPSDKAEITALESCISLYTGVYILFYFI